MTIKTVAIFGAGAVGSYCIYGLSKCDIQLSVIAKNERNERLKKNGCLINNIIYHPEVLTPKVHPCSEFLCRPLLQYA